MKKFSQVLDCIGFANGLNLRGNLRYKENKKVYARCCEIMHQMQAISEQIMQAVCQWYEDDGIELSMLLNDLRNIRANGLAKGLICGWHIPGHLNANEQAEAEFNHQIEQIRAEKAAPELDIELY